MITPEQKRRALAEIEAAHGRLDADLVVQIASDPKHVLHCEFCWDDAIAAHQHRLDTARSLIRSVRVNVTIENRVLPTICYVRNPSSPPHQQGYIALSKAARNRQEAMAVLLAEMTRIESAIRRARSVASVLNLSTELEELLRQVVFFQQKAKQRGDGRKAA